MNKQNNNKKIGFFDLNIRGKSFNPWVYLCIGIVLYLLGGVLHTLGSYILLPTICYLIVLGLKKLFKKN